MKGHSSRPLCFPEWSDFRVARSPEALFVHAALFLAWREGPAQAAWGEAGLREKSWQECPAPSGDVRTHVGWHMERPIASVKTPGVTEHVGDGGGGSDLGGSRIRILVGSEAAPAV